MLITRAAVALGICRESELGEVISLFKSYNLPTSSPFGAKELADIAMGDKKRAGGHITLVMPYAIGDSRLYKVPVESLEVIFAKGL